MRVPVWTLPVHELDCGSYLRSQSGLQRCPFVLATRRSRAIAVPDASCECSGQSC
jgi:hypothetical protein